MLFVSCKLGRVEMLVEARLPQQRFMRALLNDLPLLHDQNLIGPLDGRETVGNGDDRASAHKRL